jgi:PAS domain S-box-containing protein
VSLDDHGTDPREGPLPSARPHAFVLDETGTFRERLADGAEGDHEPPLGESVFDVFPPSRAEQLHAAIQRALERDAVQQVTHELPRQGRSRSVEAYLAPLPDGGDPREVVWVADRGASPDSEGWLTRLTGVLSDPERSVEGALEALVDLGRERFGLDVGAVARVDPDGDRLEVEHAAGDGDVAPGTELPLSETCCARIVADGGPVAATPGPATGREDGRTAGPFGVGALVGTVVEVAEGPDRVVLFGTTASDRPLPGTGRTFVELVGQWLGYAVERDRRRDRERRAEAIFDLTYQFTGLMEPDGTLVEANRTALEFGGFDRSAVVGEKVWEAPWFNQDEETRHAARDAVERAADGEFVRTELTVQGADREAVIDFSVRPVTDEEGAVTLLVPEGRDITERKRHEDRLQALNEASTRLWQADGETEIGEVTVDVAETVLDEHLVAVWSYDERADALVPLAATDAAEDLNDGPGDGLGVVSAGTREMEIFREGEPTRIEDYGAVSNPSHPEAPLGTLLAVPLGEYGQLHVGAERVTTFDDETREMVEILATNVEAALERQARERDHERSRDRLARTEELAAVGGWELDLRTDELYWTAGTRRIHEVDEDYDPDLDDGIKFFHPDDQARIAACVDRCRETGEPYEIEARLITAEGRQRWVEATGERVTVDGEPVRLQGAIRDVTDRKEREQQLSVLYRILRHNLRNDLNVVSGFAAAIDRKVSQAGADEAATEAVRGYVDSIENAVDQLVSLGDKATTLHDLVIEDPADGERCDLPDVVETVVDELGAEYPGATIDTGDVDEVVVDGAPEKVALPLRELLENALRHTESSSPTVEIRSTTGEGGYRRTDAGDYVSVTVRDRGPGIPEDELAAIRQGGEEALVHSSGLGLWLATWLASHLDGHLTFETDPDGGTAATLTLPVASGSARCHGGDDD